MGFEISIKGEVIIIWGLTGRNRGLVSGKGRGGIGFGGGLLGLGKGGAVRRFFIAAFFYYGLIIIHCKGHSLIKQESQQGESILDERYLMINVNSNTFSSSPIGPDLHLCCPIP